MVALLNIMEPTTVALGKKSTERRDEGVLSKPIGAVEEVEGIG